MVGPSVTLIDTGAAVARRTASVLAERIGRHPDAPGGHGAGQTRFLTSGDPGVLRTTLETLWDGARLDVTQLELEADPAGRAGPRQGRL